ncbi:DegQ family serine endoprotease [Roseateles sp. BYS180W]|uniref:Probable periplasmic serine endoprotease DegP-like n=1 Tax=Roseateles rivi TaxID=3299028 RepID=A0ABW7FUX1_9BURK
MEKVEKMIPARKVVWALATAGVLGAAGGALAMKATAIKTQSDAPVAAQAALVPAPSKPAPSAPATPTTNPGVALPDFASIAASQGVAVVNISVTGSMRQRGGPQLDPDDPFYEFFRRFGPPQGPQREAPTRGQGSGFIVSADGVILTNAHVVQDAKEVVVKLTDRREYKAKVLGADKRTDVAVIKIEAKGLPTVRFGSTDALRVGEWVLAIGSPLGFENSVSAGVVSAKGRSLAQENRVQFIQTDVAINPGNSGGPLFNARGEVVGINSQIVSMSGGYQGLSFAIPIEVAQRIRQQIEKHGKVQHAKLGVLVQEVNQSFADSFKLERPEGALVVNVEDDGPAAKAGVRSGDVILKLKGEAISSSADLPRLVDLYAPGERVTLEVWRNGKRETLTATLGDANAREAKAEGERDASQQGRLGLALRPLQPEERRQLGNVREGLLIEEAGGPAEAAGVRPGDVLLAVNNTPVNSLEQVRKLVGEAQKSVALLIQRGRDKIFIPVRLN